MRMRLGAGCVGAARPSSMTNSSGPLKHKDPFQLKISAVLITLSLYYGLHVWRSLQVSALAGASLSSSEICWSYD